MLNVLQPFVKPASRNTKINTMVRIQAGEEGLSPYERGRRRYKQADYAGAIEAFNEVGAYILDLFPFTPLESLSTRDLFAVLNCL